MENASKALIIAGAILLSVLIVSLGIIVFSNARTTINSSADMSDTEVEAFNGKFSSFIGTNITANQVYTLCDKVQTSNQAELKNGTKRYVQVTITQNPAKGIAANVTYGATAVNSTAEALKSKNIDRLPSSQNYTVKVTTYDGSRINAITVTAN